VGTGGRNDDHRPNADGFRPDEMSMESTTVPGPGVRHAAMITRTDADLRAVLVPELRRSAGQYDEILVVIGEHTRAVLGEQVGDLAGVLRWGDPAAFYQRLGFTYEGFRRYLADQHAAGRRVHVVAEPTLAGSGDAGLRAGRAAAYLAYEAICNETFASYGGAVTCLWNEHAHPGPILQGVRATHPYTLTAAGAVPSAGFQPPQRYLAQPHDLPWRPAPARTDHEAVLTGVGDLSELRPRLHDWAAGHQFAAEPADDLVVAVLEVATNGLRHGSAPIRIRTWHEHDTLIVQCDDSAGRAIPPTAGLRRPEPAGAAPGGRGLWLARQLADVVLTRSEPGRTSVQLHFPHQVMHVNGT
jgi:anti-sigma regulatory factor (Ser/Thr protein kinase)